MSVATSMGQIPFMSLAGSIQYFRSKKVRVQATLWLLLGSLPAAQLVAHFIGNINESPIGREIVFAGMTAADLFLLLQYGFFIGLLGAYNLYRSFRVEPKETAARKAPLPAGWRRNLATVAAGVVFGSFSALLGIGGGFFAVPFFVYACGFEPVEGVASSLFAIFVTSALTTLHYVLVDQIYFGLSLTIAAGSVFGALLGSRFATRVKQAYILRSLGILQIAVIFGYLALKFL